MNTSLLDRPTIDDDLTRRRLLGTGGGLAAGLLIGGCAEDSGGSAAPGPSSTPTTGRYPVSIEHALGTTRIPGPPQRIVTTNEYAELDALLALGLTPAAIGTIAGGEPIPWREESATEGIATFGGSQGSGDVPVENVAAQRPDLILLTGRDLSAKTYDQLTQLAPTLPTPAQRPGEAEAWRATLEIIARATGREDAVAGIVAGVRRRLDAARSAIAETGIGTVSLISNYPGQGVFVFGDTTPQGLLLDALGLARPPGERDLPGDGSQELSLERLSELDDSEAILVIEGGPGDAEELLDNPLFRRLQAAESGRVVRLPDDVGSATFFQSVASIPWAAEWIAAAFEEAFGEP